jgi:hypothetical protein
LTVVRISRSEEIAEPLPPVIWRIFATARVPNLPLWIFVTVIVVTIAPEIGVEK